MSTLNGWNVVAGSHSQRMNKHPSRGGYKGGYTGGHRGMGPRPASKRQRVSGESASSSSVPASPVDTSQLLQNFKALSLDNKLETMFSCLLEVKATNDRLLNAERTVKHMQETTQVNCRPIDLLAYKSIDIESRQRRNNLLF